MNMIDHAVRVDGIAARSQCGETGRGWSARLVLTALVALISLHGCKRNTAEEAIRANIAQIETAVEQRDAGEVTGFLADAFLANGQMDRRALHRMMAGYFLRFKNIRVLVSAVEIEINPYDPVRASMSARVAVLGLDGLLPEDGNVYQVTGEWRFDRGDWLLYSFDWE
jgi:hypothetical protein